MKKLLFINLLLFYILGFSQNRFKYLLSFKIDSTNRDFIQQEVFNLDFVENKSIFYSEALAQLDSLRTVSSSLYKSNVPEPKLDYLVSYDSKENEIFFKETIGFSLFLVNDPRKIKWHITTRTDKINNYNVQKAYCEFGGRYWIAWFTNDLQLSDGPYKFKGLPGLVLKISDSNEDYVFELFQIQKLAKLYDFTSFEKLGIQTIKVDFKKYVELKENFKKNPETTLFHLPEYSKLNIPPDDMRVLVESLKSRQKKYNNQLELSFSE